MSAKPELLFSFEMSYLKAYQDMTNLPLAPPSFKVTSGDEHLLPGHLPINLGTLAHALKVQRWRYSRAPSLTEIAAIAHYSLGLMRYEPTDPYRIHRPVPSPRCLYASELYYLSLSSNSLPPGLYHYHPIRHSLKRTEIQPEKLTPDLYGEQCVGAWLITSITDRIAFIYGAFARRLALLEAGHVMAQIRLVSQGLGLPTVPYYPAHNTEAGLFPHGEEPVVMLIHRCPGPEERTSIPAASPKYPTALERSFFECMLKRNSGHGPNGVYPAPVRLDRQQILSMVWYAMDSYMRTTHTNLQALDLTVYAVVISCHDLSPGIYKYNSHTRSFELVREILVNEALFRMLFIQPGFEVGNCPVVWFITSDTPRATRAYPHDAYIRIMTQVGDVAQRLSLAAAAESLFARPSLSYDEPRVDRLLKLHISSGTAVYEVIIGKDRNRGLPIRLAL